VKIHSDDKTILVGVGVCLSAIVALCAIDSWKDVEVARATGKAPEESGVRVKVKLGGEGGAP